MPERRVKIGASSGLHARPAAEFVQAVAASPHAVTIGRTDGSAAVDARSILSVLALHVGPGEEVVLSCPEEAAAGLLTELSALLAQDLDRQV